MLQNKPLSLTAQFSRLLLVSGIAALLLFALLRWGGGLLLEKYFVESGFQARINDARMTNLQEYVNKNNLQAKDGMQLTQWVKKQPLILLEVYRNNILLYNSKAPGEWPMEENELEVPYYEWQSYYQISFADGTAEVLVYADDTYRWFLYLTLAALLLACLVFLLIFLQGCRKIVKYIGQLCREIQALEGGDLNTSITLQGHNELTQLAQSLDSMPLAFKEQREQETALFQTHQQMITEMSHDLRTPLTTLQIYTDILRLQKYEPEQLADYLNKIDAKAAQIKQLADNIFAYSLATNRQYVEHNIKIDSK